MARYTVFYSWQSDLPRKISRDFIHDAATIAIDRVAAGISLEDAPRLDTQAVAGLPAIGDTVLRKIDQCGIFLADVSIIGETIRSDKEKKKLPNPNVMLELGYAAARIGWGRIILLMNTAFGDQEELPFDLRYRRFPFGYQIAEDRTDIDKKRDEVALQIEMAIHAMEQEEHQVVTEVLKRLDGHVRHFVREHAQHSHFWETEVGKNQIPGQLDLAIRRLLELGVIECVSFTNDVGHAYTWTHIGTLCLTRLGLQIPKVETLPIAEFPVSQVIIEDSWLDQYLHPKADA